MYIRAKAGCDRLMAAVALVVAFPVIVIVAGVVRFGVGRPILFRQTRTGKDGRPFECLKFRTMTDRCDENGRLLPDWCRQTRLGAFLRRSSLDELPQLWNIIRGDLSFIGPRPLYPEYLPYYTSEERRRHLVKPGLTGWAQVQGRNTLDFDRRLALDVWYVDNVSFTLDLRILLKTIWVVLTQRGSAADPAAQIVPLHVLRTGERAVAEFLARGR